MYFNKVRLCDLNYIYLHVEKNFSMCVVNVIECFRTGLEED